MLISFISLTFLISISFFSLSDQVHAAPGIFKDLMAVLSKSKRSLSCPQLSGDPDSRASRAISPENFVVCFEKNPLEIYRELSERARKSPDGNFSFPELKEVFGNLGKDLKNLQKEKQLSRKQRKEYQSYLEKMLEKLGSLERERFPYKDSLRFVAQFTEMKDFINYQIHILPVIKTLGLDLQKDHVFDIYKKLRQAFKEKDGRNYQLGFPIYSPQTTLKDIYEGKAKVTRWNDEGQALHRLINNPEVILLPSYNPLDLGFFTKVRQVPIYMMGLINTPIIEADGQRLGSMEFFLHDAFHAEQLNSTLSARREEVALQRSRASLCTVGGNLDGLEDLDDDGEEDDIYTVWNANAHELRKAVNALQEEQKDLAEAVDLLLFNLFHEPFSGKGTQGGGRSRAVAYPAVLEADSLASRLKHIEGFLERVKKRALANEYGPITPEVLDKLEPANQWILERLPLFKEP